MSAKPEIHMPPVPASRCTTDRVQVFNDAMAEGWRPAPEFEAGELRAMREELRAARTIPPSASSSASFHAKRR